MSGGTAAATTARVGRQRTAADAGHAWSADPYADALRAGRGPLFLRRADGWLLPLDVERWCAEADAADLEVLRCCEGPVLDVGCGPGRLVAALGALGHRALGIDVSEAAVAHTAGRGGQALLRSVFDPLPGTGRWGTALLMDGNLGIGGDPPALLDRMAQLLAPAAGCSRRRFRTRTSTNVLWCRSPTPTGPPASRSRGPASGLGPCWATRAPRAGVRTPSGRRAVAPSCHSGRSRTESSASRPGAPPQTPLLERRRG